MTFLHPTNLHNFQPLLHTSSYRLQDCVLFFELLQFNFEAFVLTSTVHATFPQHAVFQLVISLVFSSCFLVRSFVFLSPVPCSSDSLLFPVGKNKNRTASPILDLDCSLLDLDSVCFGLDSLTPFQIFSVYLRVQ